MAAIPLTAGRDWAAERVTSCRPAPARTLWPSRRRTGNCGGRCSGLGFLREGEMRNRKSVAWHTFVLPARWCLHTQAAEAHWIGEPRGCLARKQNRRWMLGPRVTVYSSATHSFVFQGKQVSCAIRLSQWNTKSQGEATTRTHRKSCSSPSLRKRIPYLPRVWL